MLRLRIQFGLPLLLYGRVYAASSAGGTDADPAGQSEITRAIFESFSNNEITLFYVFAWSCIAVFCYGVFVQIRKYARGRRGLAFPGGRHRRLLAMVSTVLSHRTVARRDRKAGDAHRLIFFGFVLLFIGTSIITLEYDIVKPLFGVTFWHGAFYLFYSLVLDIGGVAMMGGLVYMMIRRGWIKPPKLDYGRPDREPSDPDFDRRAYRIEDWFFLWALLTIGATGYLLEAARFVWLGQSADDWDTRWWSPVGAGIAELMRGLGLNSISAGSLRVALWWFHGILSLACIALIPWSKAKHVFTSAASLYARDPLASKRLSRVPQDHVEPGISKTTDFSWKQLLHFDACTKCGRCHEACPANAVGLPLSPRDLILSLAEGASQRLSTTTPASGSDLTVHGRGPGQVSEQTLWSCLTCNACVDICPVAIEHVPTIVDLRRALVEKGTMDPLLSKTLETIDRTGNSFGKPRSSRGEWSKQLRFPVKDARREPVDVLWFVGDYASFDPRNQTVSQKFAQLLHDAGVDFGILYESERNAGNDVRRVGEEGLYEVLAQGNISALRSASFKTIVTTDPHSYNTIRNEYPELGVRYPIEHYTSLLLRLVTEGRLEVTRPVRARTTFHDPCHLGRYNDGYESPRELLMALGCELVEMPRNRSNSFCCGAGGGRIWMPDPVGVEKPSHNRMHEAAEIEGLQVFVVSCPKDLTMFDDALRSTGNDQRFVVRELIELASDALTAPAERVVGSSMSAAN